MRVASSHRPGEIKAGKGESPYLHRHPRCELSVLLCLPHHGSVMVHVSSSADTAELLGK